jgi:hypothetical protein
MAETLTSSFIKNPKNTFFYGEDKGEKILYVLRSSFVTNAGWILLAILLLFAPVLIDPVFYFLNLDTPGLLSPGLIFSIHGLWYLFTFGYIFERFLNWYFNIYIITDKRIVDMDFLHLLHRKISEAPLRNIEDITYDIRGTMQVVFNYGDITIQTAAEQREFNFEGIHKPARVQDILSDLVKGVKGYGR